MTQHQRQEHTIEGMLAYPMLTRQSKYKEGCHTFELQQLSDEVIGTIRGIDSLQRKMFPREKPIKELKDSIKWSKSEEEKEKLQKRLKDYEKAGTFISLKQSATRIEKRKQSKNYGRKVLWPISVKREDGSFYTKEESELLDTGTYVRCKINTYTSSRYPGEVFYSYVPSSMVVLEEVLKEPFVYNEGEFRESELSEEQPPVNAIPVTEEEQQEEYLNDELPF